MKVNLVIFICETFKLKETHVMYRDREGYGISFGKESACNAGDPGSIWEDPLEKRRATYSSILALEIQWNEEPSGIRPMRSQRVGHGWATNNTNNTVVNREDFLEDLSSELHFEKAREFQKNIYFWFIDYAKTLDCVDHNQLWKILKEYQSEYQTTWPASWEIYMQIRKQQLELDMEQQTGSK